MSALDLFWWRPRANAHLAWPEWRQARRAWWELGKQRPSRVGTNAGDELSPLLVEAVTGRRVRWATPEKAELIAVGSIVELAASRGFEGRIWGSGCRTQAGSPTWHDYQLLAVRGPRTAELVGARASVPFGDPGLLAPLLVGATTSLKTDGPLVVPHFRSWNSGSVIPNALKGERGQNQLMLPTVPASEFVSRISCAGFVVSSSLHGIIVSHALGTPAALLGGFESGEPEFKYQDYFASMGIGGREMPVVSALDLESGGGALELARQQAVASSVLLREKAGTLASRIYTRLEAEYR